jgi:hypothetical protein
MTRRGAELTVEQLATLERLRTRYEDGQYPTGFWEWVVLNRHIFRAFVQLALDTKRAGVERWSSDAICHVLRWQTAIRERGQNALKINDHATSGLARLTMARTPELRGFFETRMPPAKNKARKLDGQLYGRPLPALDLFADRDLEGGP